MDESPIEKQQREFVEKSKKTRPAKTSGSEYFGVIVVIAFIAIVFIFVFTLA